MLSNLHTHSTFCDGRNTPEEIVLSALEKGFSSIGFSGHSHTPFDLRYCMKNTDGYIREIERLKKKYNKDIQIYLGAEEDAFVTVDRKAFDYIIGSSHYFFMNGEYFPIDSNYDYFKRCLEIFDHNVIRLANSYYTNFCGYIKSRKPDIIGHFDWITKFDEMDTSLFLKNAEYNRIAEKFVAEAAEANCIFEVNTGAISRGYRTSPYPNENLLYILKKLDAKITLSSDSHSIETLNFAFDEMKKRLFEIGFRYYYILYDGEFVKQGL
jgi:histidinol-phosphatase (PHP family)